jgi:hypothetical protein
MEGLVCWSNYGGKAGRLAGHDSYLTHPVTALTQLWFQVDKDRNEKLTYLSIVLYLHTCLPFYPSF